MEVIQKIYESFLYYFIVTSRRKEKRPSFLQLEILSGICFVLTLPLTIPLFIIGLVRGIVTDRDVDDQIDNTSKLLAVYRETSEYEYRNASTVFERIQSNIPDIELNEFLQKSLDGTGISENIIIFIFLLHTGTLFSIRLETRKEYVKRRLDENNACFEAINCLIDSHIEILGKEDSEAIFTGAVKVKKSLEQEKSSYDQEFDEIVIESGDKVLKNIYLGREVVAIRNNAGNRKKPKIFPFVFVPSLR